ncbi:MAG: hypothetical protein ACNA76_00410, partial [Anaerosomatales bacterium]
MSDMARTLRRRPLLSRLFTTYLTLVVVVMFTGIAGAVPASFAEEGNPEAIASVMVPEESEESSGAVAPADASLEGDDASDEAEAAAEEEEAAPADEIQVPGAKKSKAPAGDDMSAMLVAPAEVEVAATSGKAKRDFRQLENTTPKWIGSALNNQNSDYVEGMSVPQRLVLTGAETSIPQSYVTFEYQFTKGGKYAYDFITSWSQAIDAAQAYGGQVWSDSWKWMDYSSADFPYHATAVVPESPFAAERELAYETALGYGDRTIDVYGNAPISNVVVSIDPALYGSTSGDSTVKFTVTWEGAADRVMILYAGHIAVGLDPIPVSGIGWGPDMGAGGISGAPYHQMLVGSNQWSGAASEDNQLMSQGILYGSAITGMKWGDLNGNGVMDGDEVGLEGWEIWVDINGNGVFDEGIDEKTTTLEDGSYSLYFYLPNQSPTALRVYEIQQTGYTQTYPATGYHAVTVAPGFQYDGYNFGNMEQNPVIKIVKTGVFDAGADGYPQPGEL